MFVLTIAPQETVTTMFSVKISEPTSLCHIQKVPLIVAEALSLCEC